MKNKSILFCSLFLSACASPSLKESSPINISPESLKYKEAGYAKFSMPPALVEKDWIWVGNKRVPAFCDCSYCCLSTIEFVSLNQINSLGAKKYPNPFKKCDIEKFKHFQCE